MIDFIEGNSAEGLRAWTDKQPAEWLQGIKVVATDITNSYRAGLSPVLDHATRVADPFHVTRVGNRAVDDARRRVQQAQLGHRGAAVTRSTRSGACFCRGVSGSMIEAGKTSTAGD